MSCDYFSNEETTPLLMSVLCFHVFFFSREQGYSVGPFRCNCVIVTCIRYPAVSLFLCLRFRGLNLFHLFKSTSKSVAAC